MTESRDHRVTYKFAAIYFHFHMVFECAKCNSTITTKPYAPTGICSGCGAEVGGQNLAPWYKDMDDFMDSFSESDAMKLIADNLKIDNENLKESELLEQFRNMKRGRRTVQGGKTRVGYIPTVIFGNKNFEEWAKDTYKQEDASLKEEMETGDLVQTKYGPGKIVGFQDFFEKKDEFVFVKLDIQGVLDRDKSEIEKAGGVRFDRWDVKILPPEND